MINLLEIGNLTSLVKITEKNNDKIPTGTYFKYKGDIYKVVSFDSIQHTCSGFCSLEDIFDKELIENDIGTSCGECCPFEWDNLAIKLSEIETLVLEDKLKGEQ